jgi:hypothetical protein
MVTSASEEHSVEGVAAGSAGKGLTGPCDIGGDSGYKRSGGLQQKRSRAEHKGQQEKKDGYSGKAADWISPR